MASQRRAAELPRIIAAPHGFFYKRKPRVKIDYLANFCNVFFVFIYSQTIKKVWTQISHPHAIYVILCPDQTDCREYSENVHSLTSVQSLLHFFVRFMT